MIKNYNFRKCNLRNVHFLLLLISLLCTSGLYAQSTGDYRSNTTVGNWTALTSWQRFNGTSWVTPTAAQGYPGQYAGTGAVTILSGHEIYANFVSDPPPATIVITVNGVNNNNPFTAYTTPFGLGNVTIQSSAYLVLQGSGTGSTDYTIYLKTQELNINSGGWLYFNGNKLNLGLPQNSVVEVCDGGLTGSSSDGNANQDIFIGDQWYAIGNSNKTQFTFSEIMVDCLGTLESEPGIYSPVCVGQSIVLRGSYTGKVDTTPTYFWSIVSPSGTTTTYTTQNVTISNPIVGTYLATLKVTTIRNGYTYTNSKTTSITVLPNASLALTSAPATTNQTICINSPLTNITYTAAGTSTVTFTGLPAGVIGNYSGNVATISGTPTVEGTFNYTVTASGSCLPASQSGTFKVNQSYWVGTESNDWNTVANWTCGIPPTGADVVFAAITNSYGSMAVRDLHLENTRTIGSLINASDKNLIIKPGSALVVNNTAPANDNTAKIQIQAASGQPNGSLILTNPQLNPNVYATVQMYSTGYKGATQWNWTDPDGKAYSGYYRWQYFGIPVESNSTLVTNTTLWGSYIRQYHENLELNKYYQKWSDISNNDRLYPFTGYEITQDAPKILSFSGKLLTGDRTLTLSKTEIGGTKNYGSGYNILSNSYTAAIDIAKIVFPATGVDKTVYLYNTGSLEDWGTQYKISGNVAGAYQAIPYNTSSVLGPIPSMQGFLLIATTPGAAVTIPYNSTVSAATANTTPQRAPVEKIAANSLSWLTVDVTGKTGGDRVWIFSQDGTTHGFDNGWDGQKINQSDGISLYVDEESGKYQVSTADNLNETWLAFQAGEETEYTLNINTTALKGYKSIFLKDTVANKTIKLSDSITHYPFTAANKGKFVRRFLLKANAENKVNESLDSTLVRAFTTGNILNIQNRTDEIMTYILHDSAGLQLVNGTVEPYSMTTPDVTFYPGIYFVLIKTNNFNKAEKVIIR